MICMITKNCNKLKAEIIKSGVESEIVETSKRQGVHSQNCSYVY